MLKFNIKFSEKKDKERKKTKKLFLITNLYEELRDNV